MIVYFSATGNCEFTAEKIATETMDTAVSMTSLKGRITLKDGESLGIVTPVYFWGIPSYIDDFFKNTVIENGEETYIYYVATYGTTPGQSDYYINRHLKRKGLELSASYSIKTVDNWTVWFDVSDKEKIGRILNNEAEQIKNIVNKIKIKSKEFIKNGKIPLWLCFGAGKLYNSARKTKHLNVNSSCINCSLCEKGCPVSAINMFDGKPVWVKDKCAMCLKCLHNCPVFAINYDNKTQNNGQYIHP